MKRNALYLAGPLFSEGERAYNVELRDALSKFFDVYLPQEDGYLITDLIREGYSEEAAKTEIFRRDVAAINECDYLLILLDGRSIDEGACFELGFAFSLGKICVGLQTDFRRLASFGNNPMIDCAISRIFYDRSSLISWAELVFESANFSIESRSNQSLARP